MSYADHLRQLLEPLGVYDLSEGTFNAGELAAVGEQLDGALERLEECQREMSLTTAETFGLESIAALLAHRPVVAGPEQLRGALAALLRVNGDSFTLSAINDNLSGCGINARVQEGETAQTVEVRFPDVPGIPDGVEGMKEIIEDILPCHLAVEYVYWYITWAMMEQRFATWGAVEAAGLSWEELEKLVQ